MIGMPNGEVLFVLETEIHRVDLASAGPNYARSCTTIDLGGQLGTAVYLQIDCAFNDSVYDASRDVIYASLPSAAGSNGNSVAVIDPQTGTIQSYIPVGSEPDRLSISGGGTRLYVTLRESNRVAEVDLQTQQLVSTIRIEEEEFYFGPLLWRGDCGVHAKRDRRYRGLRVRGGPLQQRCKTCRCAQFCSRPH